MVFLKMTLPTLANQLMLRYVLDRLRANRRQTDPHWRPQYLQCPYCLVSFTVYSKMEELEADTLYFTAKANLTEKIEIDLKRNSMRNNDHTDHRL